MTAGSPRIPGPESLAYRNAAPVATCLFKQFPQDFMVEEVLGFAPTGSGEHLYLQVEKTGITTTELADVLRRVFRLDHGDIGYAGMKDKQGVCRQWFSVRQPKGNNFDPGAVESASIRVLNAQLNSRKLHIGSHKENRFRLRLRQVRDPAAEINNRLVEIAASGVANYFGPQRFGFDMANVRDFIGQLSEPVKRSASRFHQSMRVSAARAFLFNQILSSRVSDGSWNRALPGEVFNLDGTARFFTLNAPEQDPGQIQERLDRLDIHPTGLLPGKQNPKDRYRPGATVEGLESQILSPWQLMVDGLVALGVDAGRRPLRLAVRQLQYHWSQADELELSFSLSPGGYATTVLRELCIATGPHGSEETK